MVSNILLLGTLLIWVANSIYRIIYYEQENLDYFIADIK